MNIKARIDKLESALQPANETDLVRLIIAYPEDGPISVTAPPSVIDAMDKLYGDSEAINDEHNQAITHPLKT